MVKAKNGISKIAFIAGIAIAILVSSALSVAIVNYFKIETAPCLVYTSGNIYYAKNLTSGKVISSENVSYVVNEIIGSNIYIKFKDTLEFSESIDISGLHNIVLDFYGATIKLADNVDNTNIIKSNSASSQVQIMGGNWLGNAANNFGDIPTLTTGPHPIFLQNVTGLTIKDLYIEDTLRWAIRLQKCNDFFVSNIRFNQLGNSDNQDGLHIIDCNSGIIDGLYGETEDDFLAIEAETTSSSAISVSNILGACLYSQIAFVAGYYENIGSNITNISLTNIIATDNGRGLKVHMFGNSRLKNVRISEWIATNVANIFDHTVFDRIEGLTIDGFTFTDCGNQDNAILGQAGGIKKGLILRNGIIQGSGSPATPYAIRSTFEEISNVIIDDTGIVGIEIATGGSLNTKTKITDVTINNMDGVGLNIITDNNVINGITISNCGGFAITISGNNNIIKNIAQSGNSGFLTDTGSGNSID